MMKVRECKALARETLIGRYSTMIGAYFLSLLISLLMLAFTVGCAFFAVLNTGALNSALNVNYNFSYPLVVIGVLGFLAMILVSWLVTTWMEIGRQKLMLNICRGRRYGVGDLFYGFQTGAHPWKYVLASIILMIIVGVLRAVPGGIAAFITYVFKENSDQAQLVTAIVELVFLLFSLYISIRLMFTRTVLIDKPETDVMRAFGISGELMRGRKLKGFWLTYFSFLLWSILVVICPFVSLWVMPYMECTRTLFYLDADGSIWQVPGPARKAPAPAPAAPVTPAAAPAQAPQPAPAAQPEAAAEPAPAAAEANIPIPTEPAAAASAEEAEAPQEAAVSAEAEAAPAAEPETPIEPIPAAEPVPEPEAESNYEAAAGEPEQTETDI